MIIKPLTSLRFFFALIVFLSHIKFIPESEVFLYQIFNLLFRQGAIGVSFFFILSGFVLALNYKNRIKEKEVSFKEFWIARVARIYPLYLITLLFSVPLSFQLNINSLSFWIQGLIANIFLVQSFIPHIDVYYGPNGPGWSISNELFFYLLFPFLIVILSRYSKAISWGLILLLLIPLGVYLSPDDLHEFLFYINPIARLADFFIGILLFRLYELEIFSAWFQSKFRANFSEISAIGLFALFFAVSRYIPTGYLYSSFYWIPMATIIFIFSYQAGSVSDLLSNKFFILLGEISYGFYLWHIIVIHYVYFFIYRFFPFPNSYLVLVAIFLATLIISYLSYKIIEIPTNRYIRKKFRKEDPLVRIPDQAV